MYIQDDEKYYVSFIREEMDKKTGFYKPIAVTCRKMLDVDALQAHYFVRCINYKKAQSPRIYLNSSFHMTCRCF